jgi:hypothetical protein
MFKSLLGLLKISLDIIVTSLVTIFKRILCLDCGSIIKELGFKKVFVDYIIPSCIISILFTFIILFGTMLFGINFVTLLIFMICMFVLLVLMLCIVIKYLVTKASV